MKLPLCVHLSVRRWRDRVNGNSYFSARVIVDGETRLFIPFQYGYGSHPETVACTAVREAGILPSTGRLSPYLGSTCREFGIRYTEDDADALLRAVKAYGREG